MDSHCVSVVQEPGQLAVIPEHTYGEHVGAPAAPAPTMLQVPSAPVTSQRSHAPAHAVLQHSPSTQWPETHWLVPLQVWPLDCLDEHMLPASQ